MFESHVYLQSPANHPRSLDTLVIFYCSPYSSPKLVIYSKKVSLIAMRVCGSMHAQYKLCLVHVQKPTNRLTDWRNKNDKKIMCEDTG